MNNSSFCNKIAKEKFENIDPNDPFKDWIVKYRDFFENCPGDLSKNENLKGEWLNVFGSINITELLAEGAVKMLKMYIHANQTIQTRNNTITSFSNGSIMENSPENIEIFDKNLKSSLEEEKSITNLKKNKDFIEKETKIRIEKIKNLVIEEKKKAEKKANL